MADKPALAMAEPRSSLQQRVFGKIFVEHVLLVNSPSRAKAPTYAEVIGRICEAVISQDELVIVVLKRLLKPPAGLLHLVNGIVEIVEIVSQEIAGIPGCLLRRSFTICALW